MAAALRSRGGIEIHKQAIAHAPAPLGSVVRTWAGKLPARYVYHAVVIDYDVSKGTSASDVVAAVRSSLACARQDGIRSIAMPLFGAGVGGLSVRASLETILDTIEESADAFDTDLTVEVVVRDEDEFSGALKVFSEFKDRRSRATEEDELAEEFIKQLLGKS